MANTSTASSEHRHDSSITSTSSTNPSAPKKKKKKKDEIKPQTRLDLSINPSDGTLLTAPLSLIINTATDALYNDLYSMTNDVLTLPILSTTANATAAGTDGTSAASTSVGAGGASSGGAADGHGHAHTLDSNGMVVGNNNNGMNSSTANNENSVTALSGVTTGPPGGGPSIGASAVVGVGVGPGNTAAGAAAGAVGDDPAASAALSSSSYSSRLFTTKQESMSNMSFQQRRHILASTLAKHVKSISHVSALVASNLFTSGTSTSTTGTNSDGYPKSPMSAAAAKLSNSKSKQQLNLYSMSQTPPDNELSSIAIITSQALNHIRTSWVNADEAQDALYFHHDSLWKVRHHPHDVHGALEVIMKGRWSDLSLDICLKSDGYRDSMEGKWDVTETRERLKAAIRRKLILGEVGMLHSAGRRRGSRSRSGDGDGGENKNTNTNENQKSGESFWWNIVLEQNGTVVRLFHGRPFVVVQNQGQRQDKGNESTTTATTNNNNNTNQKIIYPIEARVTMLSEHHPAPWTLLSIRMRTNVKTGESNHQLEMNKEQMYRFHTLCEVAMNQEENRVNTLLNNKKKNAKGEKQQLDANTMNKNNKNNNNVVAKSQSATNGEIIVEQQPEQDERTETNNILVSRPLEKLLDLSHEFSLSWQLEILSSQADALRKGSWASRVGNGRGSIGGIGGIVVSNVHFYSEAEQFAQSKESEINGSHFQADDYDKRNATRIRPLAAMAIHFWEVDDRNGRPRMGQLTQVEHVNMSENKKTVTAPEATLPSASHLPPNDRGNAKRLTLEITAVPRVGLEVSISGGGTVMENIQNSFQSNTDSSSHLKRNVQKLLSSVQDPFQLSASDALLSAAVICAEHRCHAVLDALLRLGNKKNQSAADQVLVTQVVPSWLHLSVECGSISVGVCISYDGKEDKKRQPVLLFRLSCDSRTGCFIPSFPQPANLLRELVCNDPNASEVQLIRLAKVNSMKKEAASSNVRRSASGTRSNDVTTGRFVRDAFESLTRSIDILGRRVGVGGVWDDLDKNISPSLREKSIMQSCTDVRESLMTCSGIAAVYGVGAISASVASGVNAVPDIAGGPIAPAEQKNVKNSSFLAVPPIGVVMSQQMKEEESLNADGEISIITKLERHVCGITSSVSQQSLTLHLFEICTTLGSTTEIAKRLNSRAMPIELGKVSDVEDSLTQPPSKRAKIETNGPITSIRPIIDEVEYLSARLSVTWDTWVS